MNEPTPTEPTSVARPLPSLAPTAPPTAWSGGPVAPAVGSGTVPATPGVVVAGTSTEHVARGLAVALLAVLAAGGLAVVVWNLGFVASITSAVLAIGATYAYTWAAGAPPRRGLLPLVALIVLGVVAVALSFVAWDASQFFDEETAALTAAGYTRASFVTGAVQDVELLRSYAGDLAFYFVFAVIGTFGVIRRLVLSRD